MPDPKGITEVVRCEVMLPSLLLLLRCPEHHIPLPVASDHCPNYHLHPSWHLKARLMQGEAQTDAYTTFMWQVRYFEILSTHAAMKRKMQAQRISRKLKRGLIAMHCMATKRVLPSR
jgi:hypothetical protein